MKKVFIETSVFIRFFTKDDQKRLEDTLRLFELIESGKIHPYISNVVIQEILFVLTKVYKFPKPEVLQDIQRALTLRNMTLIETTDTPKALSLFKRRSVKYGDCLIATQVPKGVQLATYDADFSKLANVASVSPADIASSVSIQES